MVAREHSTGRRERRTRQRSQQLINARVPGRAHGQALTRPSARHSSVRIPYATAMHGSSRTSTSPAKAVRTPCATIRGFPKYPGPRALGKSWASRGARHWGFVWAPTSPAMPAVAPAATSTIVSMTAAGITETLPSPLAPGARSTHGVGVSLRSAIRRPSRNLTVPGLPQPQHSLAWRPCRNLVVADAETLAIVSMLPRRVAGPRRCEVAVQRRCNINFYQPAPAEGARRWMISGVH